MSASNPLSLGALERGSESSEEDEDPKIVFAAVAKGSVILARFTPFDGNFEDVVDHVLNKIAPTDRKLTLLADDDQYYMYHVIQDDDGLVFMCITDDDFARPKAFLFLQDVKSRFRELFTGHSVTSIPYSLNSRFSFVLEELMREYSSAHQLSLVALTDRMHHQMEEMEQIGIRNIDSAQPLTQFEVSVSSSVASERRPLLGQVTSQITSNMCHCNWKTTVVICVCATIAVVGVTLILLLAILIPVCGVTIQQCLHT